MVFQKTIWILQTILSILDQGILSELSWTELNCWIEARHVQNDNQSYTSHSPEKRFFGRDLHQWFPVKFSFLISPWQYGQTIYSGRGQFKSITWWACTRLATYYTFPRLNIGGYFQPHPDIQVHICNQIVYTWGSRYSDSMCNLNTNPLHHAITSQHYTLPSSHSTS